MTTRLMIMGHGRHGKDTVAEMIDGHTGLGMLGSSEFACKRAVFPHLRRYQGYQTWQECFEDRHNHRATWYDLIRQYNREDKARLMRELYGEANIYVGIRCRDEFYAGKDEGLFNLAIWVDAAKRKGPECESSCTVTADDADIIITNNGTEAELAVKVQRLVLAMEGMVA